MKIKKRHLTVLVLVILILGAFFYYEWNISKKKKIEPDNRLMWMVDRNGYLYYPLDRGTIKFKRETFAETDNLTISKIIYPSTRANIYGLLVLPKIVSERMPGVILLPGAGVSKESELELAKKIAGLGAAVLTIDQRGVGETDGQFPPIDVDYSSFLNATEPVQHLMIYDALRGYDLLYSAPFIDPDRIMIAGESLGGRVAIIAAALDRRIKGVFVISSAGFGFTSGPDEKKNTFIKSIDSDHYIRLITPRKLVMMHNVNDKNIPITSAIKSFAKAQEPKQFVLINDTSCNHGYCDSMYSGLVDAMDYIVGIKAKTVMTVPEKAK